MSHELQKSDEPIKLTAPEGGVTTNVPVMIGGLFVIPACSAADGETFSAITEVVIWLPKNTSTAFAEGDPVYWDVADAEFNDDAGNLCAGHAIVDAAESDTRVKVRLSDLPVAAVASLSTRAAVLEAGQFAGQTKTKIMPTSGTSKTLSVSDTYVNFTEDAITFDHTTEPIEVGDVIEWDFAAFLSAMNAAYLTTLSILIGALEIDVMAITTGDTNDWAKCKGMARCTADGASSTWEVFAGEGCNSDGGSVTRDTPTYLAAQTGPATTSDVVVKARIKAATGNAGNHAVQANGVVKLHKAT